MSAFDDYMAAPASAASAASGPTFDQYVGDAPAGATPDITQTVAPGGVQPQAAAAPSAGFWPNVGRQLGLTARIAGNGVADALGTVVDPFDRLIGAQPASQIVRSAVNANTPTPQGGVENAVQGVGSAVANPLNAIGGEVAAPGSTAIGRLAGVLPRAGAPGLWRSALGGATTAGIQPTTPDETPGQYAGSVAGGAAGGAAFSALAGIPGRILSPNVDPAIQRLMGQGVTPTPGMIAGGGANRFEQALTSMPFIGPAIANARSRAINSFNVAAYNDALAPIGGQLPAGVGAGSEGVQAVHDAVGAAYQALVPNATFRSDMPFLTDLAAIRSNLAQRAPSMLDQYDNIVDQQLTQKATRATGYSMTGQQWNDTRSMISSIQRDNTVGETTANQRSLANALGDLNTAVNDNVARHSPPGLADDLANANAAYARYKRIEQAAGYTGARNSGNVFTPADYSRAIGANSTSFQKGTNTGMNAGFASDAQALANNVPNSGTPERAGAIGTILALPHLISHPELIAGIPAAHAAYSPAGVNVLGRMMTQRPAAAQAVGAAMNRLVPGAVVGGGLLGGQLPALAQPGGPSQGE